MKDLGSGDVWTLNSNVIPDDEDYYTFFGFGYVKSFHASLGLIQENEVFVAKEDSIKANIIRLKNTLSDKRKLKIVYYIRPVLGEDELKTNGFIKATADKDKNIVFAENSYGEGIVKTMYVSSSEKILSFTGNNLSFIGRKNDLSTPNGVYGTRLSQEDGLGCPSCVAVELEVELDAFSEKQIVLCLGEAECKEDIYSVLDRFQDVNKAQEELRITRDYWSSILRKLQVRTGDSEIDFMLNGWALYQTIVCRLYARSAYYQSGGALGFRDQLQDSLAAKFVSPEILKEQILKHSRHQFEEGDVEHWWHEETKRGIRTRFSDDLLWLVYCICEYIEWTSDFSLLDIETPYISGNLLSPGEDEKYDIHEQSDLVESIYMHSIRAIEKSLDFGENGLPKIGSRRLERRL